METNKINLFVFDTKENFENNKRENKNSLGSEGSTFKSITCVEDRNQFEQKFSLLAEDEFVFMIVHVFYTKEINGIKLFEASGIRRKYPKLGFMFVSEGDSKVIKQQMIVEEFDVEDVHKYHRVQSNLEDEKFPVYTKKEVLQLAGGQAANLRNENQEFLNETNTSKRLIESRVFIGHGRSAAWRDLKDFLSDRLGLKWDEFNRESPAGMATKERLEEMLDSASFAFLIMTGEDEHADQSMHARENVIHEIGLFQGKLGFRKAIVLLEDGCKEFSNIIGLTQIRFPKENIKAVFEEIRKVLERERILQITK